MTRHEHIEVARAALEDWTRPASSSRFDERAFVESLPGSSRLNRELRALLGSSLSDTGFSLRTREQLEAVLAGRAPLSALLEPGVLPIPDADHLPAEVREIIESIQEEEH